MSSIGKIFIVVNLVLSALFVGWAAFALNENSDWKAKYDTETARISAEKKKVDEELSKVRAEKATADGTISSLRTESEAAKADLERTKKDLKDKSDEIAAWAADLNKLAATHQTAVDSNTKLQAEKDKAVQAQHDAEKARDAALAAQATAEKELGDAKAEGTMKDSKIAELEKSGKQLADAKKKVETDLASLQSYTGATLETVMAMPKIDGRVLGVSMEVSPGLISINKGKADGVTRGFTFEIYDGTRYKGKARVEFVHDNMCSAILINSVPGQTVRQGDSASTQI